MHAYVFITLISQLQTALGDFQIETLQDAFQYARPHQLRRACTTSIHICFLSVTYGQLLLYSSTCRPNTPVGRVTSFPGVAHSGEHMQYSVSGLCSMPVAVAVVCSTEHRGQGTSPSPAPVSSLWQRLSPPPVRSTLVPLCCPLLCVAMETTYRLITRSLLNLFSMHTFECSYKPCQCSETQLDDPD